MIQVIRGQGGVNRGERGHKRPSEVGDRSLRSHGEVTYRSAKKSDGTFNQRCTVHELAMRHTDMLDRQQREDWCDAEMKR